MTREPYYKYFISSNWHGRVETPAAIGAKFLAMLDALSGIDPIFENWLLADFPNPSSGDPDVDGWNIKAIPVASARNRITEVVENYVTRDDFNDPYPDAGYTGIATTREIGGPRVASVRLNAGGKREGGLWLNFGDDPAPDLTIVTYPALQGGAAGDQCSLARTMGLRRGVSIRCYFRTERGDRARPDRDEDRQRGAGSARSHVSLQRLSHSMDCIPVGRTCLGRRATARYSHRAYTRRRPSDECYDRTTRSRQSRARSACSHYRGSDDCPRRLGWQRASCSISRAA